MALITYGATTTGSLSDVVSAYGGELMIVLYTLVEMQIMDRRITGSALTGKGGIRMLDREKVIKAIDNCVHCGVCLNCEYEEHISCKTCLMSDALALLKEQDSLLGIQQTADGITFISTGTANQGEARGILLGKLLMHEWIYKELLYKGLLTDDIQSVFEQAKHI